MASPFELLPAIDLRGGRVVRLEQGDFARETAFGDDPAAVARDFAAAGARWLHVVDLDGARLGAPTQVAAVATILEAAGQGTRIEVAGGLRTDEAVATALGRGATRVVIGTQAIRHPVFAGVMVEVHGAASIAVAIDVRDGRAVGDAWSGEDAGRDADETIRRLADVGVETFEVTAIDRDGLLGGPDLRLYERLVGLGRGEIVASAGIASIADLRAVRDVGCRGAIVGRALYDGTLDLAMALAALAQAT